MAADSVDVVERALGRFLETGEPHWALLDERLATRDHDLLDAGEYREDAMVCRVQDGRIACIDYYNNRAQALAQVGLEP